MQAPPAGGESRPTPGLPSARLLADILSSQVVVLIGTGPFVITSYSIHYTKLYEATTPDHLKRLFRATRDITFCFDGDRAGREVLPREPEQREPESAIVRERVDRTLEAGHGLGVVASYNFV